MPAHRDRHGPARAAGHRQGIERELGRATASARHGTAVIDIDILLVGGLRVNAGTHDAPARAAARAQLRPDPRAGARLRDARAGRQRLADALAALDLAGGVRWAGPPLDFPAAADAGPSLRTAPRRTRRGQGARGNLARQRREVDGEALRRAALDQRAHVADAHQQRERAADLQIRGVGLLAAEHALLDPRSIRSSCARQRRDVGLRASRRWRRFCAPSGGPSAAARASASRPAAAAGHHRRSSPSLTAPQERHVDDAAAERSAGPRRPSARPRAPRARLGSPTGGSSGGSGAISSSRRMIPREPTMRSVADPHSGHRRSAVAQRTHQHAASAEADRRARSRCDLRRIASSTRRRDASRAARRAWVRARSCRSRA